MDLFILHCRHDDGLAMWRARASAATVLTKLSWICACKDRYRMYKLLLWSNHRDILPHRSRLEDDVMPGGYVEEFEEGDKRGITYEVRFLMELYVRTLDHVVVKRPFQVKYSHYKNCLHFIRGVLILVKLQLCIEMAPWCSQLTSHLKKQGKSEGFDSCDQPNNLIQIGSRSLIF